MVKNSVYIPWNCDPLAFDELGKGSEQIGCSMDRTPYSNRSAFVLLDVSLARTLLLLVRTPLTDSTMPPAFSPFTLAHWTS